MEFKSYEMAYAFYNKYVEHAGFNVRKSRSRAAYREICCSKEGKNKYRGDETKRERRRGSARIGCRAYVRVRNVVIEGEVVSVVFDDVVVQHNHPLTPSPSAVKHMRSHKQRGDTLIEFVDTMQQCREPQSSIMGVLSDMHGDRESIPFTTRDLENSVFAGKRLMFDIRTDEEGVVKNVFWSHASMQAEYADFGDAITFDTTYKTNIYGMPLAMFVGANHHLQSTLFGCALLRDERAESFEWLFETFKNCMGDCPTPRCILTDQDTAMAIAVGRAFPETIHRLCRWHIIDGHSDHLNTIFMRHKDIETEMMYAWKEFIDKFGLHDSTELRDLYDIRHRWVPAFFKEDYCGHMTSTQRSESFNRLVKSSFVDHQTALHRFARRILEVVLSRKEKEAAETRACQVM
ncbi:hypothetical protein DAI22_12g098650 [Oryza sativa Japonica Group]|nr:hypothetical protein DAI22_12g098650 [Oryza sativa Japonica Group]